MADFSNYHNLAKRLLEKYGAAMIFVKREESGQIDPMTGKRARKETFVEFMGVIASPSSDKTEAAQKSSLIILAAGAAIENPDVTDLIRFNGKEYAIKQILPVTPAGDALLWKFVASCAGKTDNA